ncbi:3-dehydroquinate synthase [Fibrobacterota bacterium]
MMNDEAEKTQPVEFEYEIYEQKFTVPFEYPVYFTRSLFHKDNPLLASVMDRGQSAHPHRVMMYVDSGVVRANDWIVPMAVEYFRARKEKFELVMLPQVISGGETAKSGWSEVRHIMTALGDNHMCRQSFVMAVGGGGMLDMVGFAVSLVHRGLRLIRIPTTVLSQNDAGVGVKNGMNERETKNFIGSFAPPFAVVNDFDFLSTLQQKDWVGGIAEAFKVAIIKDADFFSFLTANARALKRRDAPAMEELIRRCAALHLEHISTGGDPFEFGSSRPLDFGHWSAHKLETLSDFTMGHGQAVAVGIALDSFYAAQTGRLSHGEMEGIITGLKESGLPVWHRLLEKRDADDVLEIAAGLEQFREHLGGELTLAMPEGIGRQCEVNHLEMKVIEEGVVFLRSLAEKQE